MQFFLDVMEKLDERITGMPLVFYVLIDIVGQDGAKAAMFASDEIIILTTPEMSAVTDALKTIKLAEEINKPVTGVIITRFRGAKTEMPISNIKDMLETSLLGIIPEDEAIKESQILKNAVIYTHPKSRSAKQYVDASKRILGDEVKFENPVKTGFLSTIFKTLGLGR